MCLEGKISFRTSRSLENSSPDYPESPGLSGLVMPKSQNGLKVLFKQKTSQQTVPDWCRTDPPDWFRTVGLVPD